jgi:hypothetical protein
MQPVLAKCLVDVVAAIGADDAADSAPSANAGGDHEHAAAEAARATDAKITGFLLPPPQPPPQSSPSHLSSNDIGAHRR